MKTESLSVRLEPNILKALKKWAEAECRTVNSLLRVIIRQAMEKKNA